MLDIAIVLHGPEQVVLLILRVVLFGRKTQYAVCATGEAGDFVKSEDIHVEAKVVLKSPLPILFAWQLGDVERLQAYYIANLFALQLYCSISHLN